MENACSLTRRRIGLLFPWILLLPLPVYVLSVLLYNTPNNVLYQLRLQEFSFFSPVLCVILAALFAAPGIAAAVSLRRAMPRWRWIVTWILSGLHLTVGVGTLLLIIVLAVWAFVAVVFLHVSV